MAVITRTVQEDVQKVTDRICDCCEKSCYGELNFCGIQFVVSGGYDSPAFPDDEQCYPFDVCEICTYEWIKTFKTKPWWVGEIVKEPNGKVRP